MPTPDQAAETQVTAVALPPPPAPETRPEPPPADLGPRRARHARRLDLALAALALAFAFLLGSYPIRNSDFWMRLASGRLLARGQYEFGKDPFAYTTGDAYWANHAWLFDLAAYGLYRADPGGSALVALKALLLTALAWLMLRVGVPGEKRARWVAPACAALAFLAMAPRLLFQPALVSLLLLGLTFWLLWRWQSGASRDPRVLVLLPALCALWVNLDAWFLLGPLLVGLVWLGGLLPGGPEARRLPAWVFPACLGACLLSPHHVHAFTLPAEVSPALAGLRGDVRFQATFASPWQAGLSLPAPQAAYFALVGAGLLSFILAGKHLHPWRAPVWLAFALLGAWQVRTVPFFAVVAAPITALNVQDFLLRRAAPDPGRPALAGRYLLLLAGLALPVLAWTGWALGRGGAGRRVAFAVQPDPSLEHCARTLARWQDEGKLRDGEQVFTFHPDAAHYLAWFCPGRRGFFDHRVGLFPEVAREYVGVCQGFDPTLAAGGRPARPARRWPEVFRDRKVAYLLLYDPALGRLAPALRRLGGQPDWEELHVDGQAVLFGWRGARPGERRPFDPLRVGPERLAFGPQGDEERWALPAPPDRGPPGPAESGSWRARFLDPARPAPWEGAASAIYLRAFDDTAPLREGRARAEALARYGAGLAGLFALPPTPPTVPAALALPTFRVDLPVSPLPLLAARAARAALAKEPRDANAYLLLGQAYLGLARRTREADRDASPAPLAMLRHAQAVTALERAVALNPGLLAARSALAGLYTEQQYLDVALGHRRAELRLAERAGPARGEDLDALRRAVDDLEREVQDRENEFVVRSAEMGDDVLAKALLARDLGLAGKALDVLLRSQVLLFGPPGARLQIELLLLTGRAEEAGECLDLLAGEEAGEAREQMGYSFYRTPAYGWLRACRAAAAGDYAEAGESIQSVLGRMRAQAGTARALGERSLPVALGTEVGLRPLRQHLLLRMAAWQMRRSGGQLGLLDRDTAADLLVHAANLQAEQAGLQVVLALLALERGRPDQARSDLDSAFAACRPGLHPDGAFAGRPLATAYRQRLRAARR